jgi:hypothetical protein
MLLKLWSFIIPDGVKNQKTLTISVLQLLLRKCNSVRYCNIYTLQYYYNLEISAQKQITGYSERFVQFYFLVAAQDNVCTCLPFQTAKVQIQIAQLNQSEPRSAACRGE